MGEPTIMQAMVLTGHGGPEVLSLATVPRPEPGPEEVLVRVAATALNRADVLQRQGRYPGPRAEHEIPGLEFAGRVESIGDRVVGHRSGDLVMGIVAGGAYAEFVVVHERQAMAVPESIGLLDAAAIPEVWITAFDALVVQAGLTSGRVALIHAGASGVGTAAIQIAKFIGARIVVTTSTRKVAACVALGADAAIDYTSQDFVESTLGFTQARGADVILDVVGGDYLARNLACLADQGTIIQVGTMAGNAATLDLGRLLARRARLIGTVLRPRPLEEKIAVTRRFAAEILPGFTATADGSHRALRPVVDRRFPLAEISEAHRYMEANANIGKIVIEVDAGLSQE